MTPNPSSGKYKIRINTSDNSLKSKIIVRNTLGGIIKILEIENITVEIELSNFVDGVYFLTFEHGDERITKLRIKN